MPDSGIARLSGFALLLALIGGTLSGSGGLAVDAACAPLLNLLVAGTVNYVLHVDKQVIRHNPRIVLRRHRLASFDVMGHVVTWNHLNLWRLGRAPAEAQN